ncbi:MAG: hypothetical protein IJF88_10675 [Oscillospiraceae bacterium]|nr:hypothetical protein [Oscillospiraceae bacterium]
MNEANPGEALHAQEPGVETSGPQSGAEAPVPTAAEPGADGATGPGAPDPAQQPEPTAEAPGGGEPQAGTDPAARARQREALIQSQLRQISELDPEVKSLEDLTHTEQYGQLYALVRRGYTLLDAYKLANFDRLTRRAELAAAQRYRNALDGVRHLTATQTRGAGRPVPADVAAQYRALNPGVSDGEIARHYQRYHQD